MIIDIFSKFGWAIPLKTKKGVEIAKAFLGVWKTKTVPTRLFVDKGLEFYNKFLDDARSRYNVQIYSTENEEKSSVVERWNQTIKRLMYKYFTTYNTTKYIDVLPDIVNKYNNTYHRSIKCTPTEARDPSKYQQVFDALYQNKKSIP